MLYLVVLLCGISYHSIRFKVIFQFRLCNRCSYLGKHLAETWKPTQSNQYKMKARTIQYQLTMCWRKCVSGAVPLSGAKLFYVAYCCNLTLTAHYSRQESPNLTFAVKQKYMFRRKKLSKFHRISKKSSMFVVNFSRKNGCQQVLVGKKDS